MYGLLAKLGSSYAKCAARDATGSVKGLRGTCEGATNASEPCNVAEDCPDQSEGAFCDHVSNLECIVKAEQKYAKGVAKLSNCPACVNADSLRDQVRLSVMHSLNEQLFCQDGTSICGNGVIEDNEQCDDGNLANSDGCSQYCLFE